MRLFLCCLLFVLVACERPESPQQSGRLVVAMRDDPVFCQAASEEGAGFECDLVSAFARTLNIEPRFVFVRSQEELIELLRSGKVHMATGVHMAAGVRNIRFSSPLRETRQVVVQHAEALPVDDLAGRSILTLPASIEATVLRSLPLRQPPIITEVVGTNAIDLLARVASGHADLVATDSAHFDVALNYYPDLAIALELPARTSYAWAFAFDDAALPARADEFIAGARADGTLARLHDRYFGHIKRITAMGAAEFIERVSSHLPRYRYEFQQAQEISGLDWRLLAALAYQESKWNPLATSFTKVRGMMMLTEDTADRMRVTDRLDARQSIRAGARYLADLIDELPAEVKWPDRLWLALAAYNLGMGHLNGARAIALGLKRDPNSWFEMKQVLPLLAREEYYRRLKSGRGRGGEAVIMVENVRTYHDILMRFEPPHRPVMSSAVN